MGTNSGAAFGDAEQRVAVVDGAPWIRAQMELHLAELDGLGLDFYHLSENAHRARRQVFGEDSAEGREWADTLMHLFKHEGYGAAWERLVQWRAQLARSRKRRSADRLLNYVSTRQPMIRYPAFRARGWQIGSGPTESQCKLCTKAAQRPRPPLGPSSQRLRRCGPRHAGSKRARAHVLAKCFPLHRLAPPRTLTTPRSLGLLTKPFCDPTINLRPLTGR